MHQSGLLRAAKEELVNYPLKLGLIEGTDCVKQNFSLESYKKKVYFSRFLTPSEYDCI